MPDRGIICPARGAVPRRRRAQTGRLDNPRAFKCPSRRPPGRVPPPPNGPFTHPPVSLPMVPAGQNFLPGGRVAR
jgi:hypothetical protein